MNEKSLVRRLMLPLHEYAMVSIDACLIDVLRALDRAQRSVPPGRQPHRALLVQRPNGAVVGKLGYRAILKALRPEQRSCEMDDSMRRAGVTDDMISVSLANLEFLHQDLPDLCERACSIKVSELVLQKPDMVDIEAGLQELLDVFLSHHAHSVLVTDKGQLVGVVRISDLFDEVTRVALRDTDEALDE